MARQQREQFSTEIVVCICAHSNAMMPGTSACRYGARLRADHEYVQANPQYFIHDGASDAEVNARIAAASPLMPIGR